MPAPWLRRPNASPRSAAPGMATRGSEGHHGRKHLRDEQRAAKTEAVRLAIEQLRRSRQESVEIAADPEPARECCRNCEVGQPYGDTC